MTQKDPRPQFDPKHRIIGAVVIVAAAVIFLPLILSEREPPTPADASAVATGSPVEETKVAITHLTEPAAAPQSAGAAETRAASGGATSGGIVNETVNPAASTKTASVKVETSKAAATSTKTPASPTAGKPDAVKTVSVPARAEARIDHGWVVQVGTFANIGNATRLADKLRSQGHPVTSERITLEGSPAVRLRVGPFRDKALALTAQSRIAKEIGVQGAVRAYP